MLRRLPAPGVAPELDARWSARAGPGPGTSRPTARAPRDCAPPAGVSAAEVRAGPQAVHVAPRRAPVSPRTSIWTSACRSWTWISARFGSGWRHRRRARTVGQDDRQAARSGSARAAARPIRQAARSSTDAATLGRWVVAVGAVIGAASRWRWNRAPRSHSRNACQWIIRMVLWVTSGWRSSIRRARSGRSGAGVPGRGWRAAGGRRSARG